MQARWRVRLLAGLTVPLALAGALTGAGRTAATAATTAAAPCEGWISELPQPASPGPVSNILSGVTVLSACNAYAAGVQTFDTEQKAAGRIRRQVPVLPLIEHWNGTSWSVQPTPPVPSDHLHIASIHASSPTSIWAAGGFRDSKGVNRTLILHSDGRTWRQVPSPSPSATFSDLTRVRAVSAKNAWAVGFAQSGTVKKTLILHWDGKRWQRVASPSPGKPGSSEELLGVTATSATSAWAVGVTETAGGQQTALILRLKDRKWVRMTIPRPGPGSLLNAVGASSAANVWAAGRVGSSHLLALHWNGRAWQHVATPLPAPEEFDAITSVAVTAASNAWAVVTNGDLLHWGGRSWQRVPIAAPRGVRFDLTAVGARPGGDAWAVGSADNGTRPVRALALHCC